MREADGFAGMAIESIRRIAREEAVKVVESAEVRYSEYGPLTGWKLSAPRGGETSDAPGSLGVSQPSNPGSNCTPAAGSEEAGPTQGEDEGKPIYVGPGTVTIGFGESFIDDEAQQIADAIFSHVMGNVSGARAVRAYGDARVREAIETERQAAKKRVQDYAEWMREENARGGQIDRRIIETAEWCALKASGER
jgi:hypothetical protein